MEGKFEKEGKGELASAMGYECSAMLYVKGSQSFARSPSSRWLDVLTVPKLKLINFEEKQWYPLIDHIANLRSFRLSHFS